MQLEEVNALFKLAGWNILSRKQLENQYWPDHESYKKVREQYPWWFVETEEGFITIGWRKRVINIDWSGTKRRGEVTTDDVTKSDTHVHAYSIGDAVKYLAAIKQLPIPECNYIGIKSYQFIGKKEIIKELTNLFQMERFTDSKHGDYKGILSLIESFSDDTNMSMTLDVSEQGIYYMVSIKIGKMEITLL